MKVFKQTPKRNRGSILLIALGIIIIIGIGLGSYLWLVRTQNMSAFRSMYWNAAMAHAEAGVEEAMAQLNPGALNFSTNIDRSANGWGTSGSGFGPVTRTLANGSYSTTISTDAMPIITSVGYATMPSSSSLLSRTVQVTAQTSFSFQVAIAARNGIDFKGTEITVDSYDSADSAYSTGGFYDPAKRKAGGDVASIAGLINVQNADIKGKVMTGPTAPYPTLNNGEVGDLSWTTPGTIQPGWYRNDFNVDFPDVLVPYTTGLSPTVVSGSGGVTTNIIGGTRYIINGDFSLKSGDVLYVTGKAYLYVTGNFTMQSGGGKSSLIQIAPNSTLKLFVGGASSTFTTVNTSGNAATFQYFGLPSNTSVTWSGNATYLGTVYAPQAAFTLGGGGSTPLDFQGSAVVDSVNLNGHFSVHYDENLRRIGPVSGYRVMSWREL